jgi:hypothetical protein
MFALFDMESGLYVPRRQPYGPGARSVGVEDQYMCKSSAVELASLLNVPRNIPNGRPGPCRKYSNRPQVVVQELDQNGALIATHSAPPEYIYF